MKKSVFAAIPIVVFSQLTNQSTSVAMDNEYHWQIKSQEVCEGSALKMLSWSIHTSDGTPSIQGFSYNKDKTLVSNVDMSGYKNAYLMSYSHTLPYEIAVKSMVRDAAEEAVLVCQRKSLANMGRPHLPVPPTQPIAQYKFRFNYNMPTVQV